ncbi:MAG: indole-3-glycerol phosphate synthase TrpC [Candidatus Dormibacteria bacterium]
MTATSLGALAPLRQRAVERVQGLGALERDEARIACRSAEPPRPFLPGGGFGVVAEMKRRSPSAGELLPGLEPAEVARRFAAAGAQALSVLTETVEFGGSLDDLRAARRACRLPILRKDFLVDPVDVLQSRAAGADAVLLIVALLERPALLEMMGTAEEWGMSALVEAHTEAELDCALGCGATLVGLNNRDLSTLTTDIERCFRLRAAIPPGVAVVAESGFAGAADVARASDAGFRAVLVGESLMRAPSPWGLLSEMVQAGAA